MTTTVVNVKAPGVLEDVRAGRAVYIGRAAPRLGLPDSPFANPFRIGVHGDRAAVIQRYAEYLDRRADLDPAELRGQVLACWCAPAECHGDVLAARTDGAGQ